MDKLNMQTKNLADEKFEKLKELFPNAITESIDENGNLVRAIDKDVLAQEISNEVVEGRDERYQFTWPEKRKAILNANAPISKTLRPCREESLNFDETENLYIEGDNLEVLKLLQETYLGKVKMIYIDPPYNTGNNILYKNDFKISNSDYMEISNQKDDIGNNLFLNLETNGRFHTDWLNIMYPRLKLARNLLKEDGYLVIAIDDNELYNLKKILDEIYGEQNYIGTIVTRCNPQGRNKNNIDPVHEYHLVYSKNFLELPLLKIEKTNVNENEYRNLRRSGTNSRKNERPYRFFPMLAKDGKVEIIPENEYKNIYANNLYFNEDYIEELRNKYERKGYQFILPIASNGEEKVWQREYYRVIKEYNSYIVEGGQVKVPVDLNRTPISLWAEDIYSNVSNGTNRLKKIFDNKSIFDFSKSIFTIRNLISLNSQKDDVILDFFSGSATTAHAVMQLNAEDGGNRKFIMVQLPEETDEKSEAYKVGYKNICEIGKERIRRAGKKILEDNKDKDGIENLDIGFRVLKTDTSNMKDVYYRPGELNQNFLDNLTDNIKDDRTGEDLLFQVLLDLGVPLSSEIQVENIDGKEVYLVDQGYLIACFDKDIDDDLVTKIAKRRPAFAIFRDSSMVNDSALNNFDQIFERLSPETTRRVI